MQTMSGNGRALTEFCEGLELTAYQDQAGVWTIGYGHTGPDVHEGLTITQEQAEALLEKDLEHAEYIVNTAVKTDLNQNQFDALVDFVYNLGEGNFGKSTLLKLVNANDMNGASQHFEEWDKAAGQVNRGLLRRRQMEQALFLTAC